MGRLVRKCAFQQKFKIVKNHYMVHYVPFIILFEDPETFSTQAGEMCHKAKVKAHFRKSNQREAANFVSPMFTLYCETKIKIIKSKSKSKNKIIMK